jgi:hypothetical protein
VGLHYAAAAVRPSLERGRCTAVSIPFRRAGNDGDVWSTSPQRYAERRPRSPSSASWRARSTAWDVSKTAEPNRQKRVQLGHRQRIRAVEVGDEDKLPARGGNG